MRLTHTKRILVLAAGALGVALLAQPAQSAGDTTPPTLTTPAKASFGVGGQIDVGSLPGCGDEPHDIRVYSVPLKFSWRGADDSGSVRYTLEEMTGAAGPETVFANRTRRSYSAPVGSNGDQFCGGGNWSIYQWNLTAADPAANTVTNHIYGGRIRLTQDTNFADDADYATQPTIDYTGMWGLSHCKCWSDGAIHKTTAKGATATITPQPFGDSAAPSKHHVGLVMHMGPDRGEFQVYVDGKLLTTVDLYAPTPQPRTIVWQTGFRHYGHDIRIVNLATPGRPRIDLDAVLTN